jgi:hypothetical protein
MLMELDRSTIFLAFIGEKYCPRVPDVSSLVATRPWIEALQDKSIVEIEVAAALLVNPSKFESRSFVYIREGSFLDSLVGLSTGDYIERRTRSTSSPCRPSKSDCARSKMPKSSTAIPVLIRLS